MYVPIVVHKILPGEFIDISASLAGGSAVASFSAGTVSMLGDVTTGIPRVLSRQWNRAPAAK